MKTDKQLWKICKEIYREMFKRAEPKADFDVILDSVEGQEKEFFMKYFLESEKQEKIIDSICKKHKLKFWERRKVDVEVYLGCSPNTSKKTWKEHRENVA